MTTAAPPALSVIRSNRLRDVALSVVCDALPSLEAVRHIGFVLFSRQDLTIYEEKLKDFFND